MLKSILSNNLNHQQYIYPLYRPDCNNNLKKVEEKSRNGFRENGVCSTVHVKPLVEGGEHPASLINNPKFKVRKSVQFAQELIKEENESNNAKPQKQPQQRSSKKKTRVKKQNSDAFGDAVSNVKRHECEKEVTQNGDHVKWDFSTTKWAARMENLSEIDEGSLKSVSLKSNPEASLFFCDNQAHFSIGSGPDFSSVYLGLLNGNTEVVVKKINAKRVPLLDDDGVQKLLLSLPSCDHFAKIHHITRDKTHFYVIRELCESSLKQEVKMRMYVPENVRPPLDIVSLCQKMALALSSLHRNGIPHLSLKPENIFIEKSREIKLADYYIHERIHARKKQYVNETASLCWLPSETLGNNKSSDISSDIASLGMIFYWLITGGGHPFGDPENAPEACVKNIVRGHYNLKAVNDVYAHHLVQHMIFKEQEKRLTIAQVLEHPYFWSDDTKLKYMKLLSETVSLILDAKLESDPMCNNLIEFIKLRERAILQSNSDSKALGRFPKEARCNLLNLISYAFNPMHDKDVNFTENALKAYPGILLELHSEFTSEDLTMLLVDIKPIVEKQKHYLPLKLCLSADSGVYSPGTDDLSTHDDFGSVNFPFEFDTQRYHYDSECYASTDDGIDILSPVCGSLGEDNPFSSPVKIKDFREKWSGGFSSTQNSFTSPKEYSSSVDKHFEFDRVDFDVRVKENFELKAELWTDMDELD